MSKVVIISPANQGVNLEIVPQPRTNVLVDKGATGPQGPQGPTGPQGPQGSGAGVAAGGTTGQALVKTSNADYATGWVTAVAEATHAASADSAPYSGLTGTVPTWNQNTTGNAATATNVAYSGLTGTVPTWNQNTTGTAANITATSNSTLTTLSGLNLPYSQLSGTVPTWNQNTTGNAANVTGVVAIANGGTGAITAPLALTALGAYPASNPNGYNTGTVTSVAATAGTGISVTGSPITTSGTLNIINTAPDQTVAIASGTGISVTGTYPNFTIINTSPSSGGTVTSVTGTAPVVSSGGATPAISMAAATTSVSGYLTSTDWNTFNGKGSVTSVAGTGTVSGISLSGTVTSSGSLTLGGTLDLSSPPAIGGTAAAAGTFTTLTGTTSTTTPIVQNSAAAAIAFKTNSATSAVTQFNINHTASAVNYVQVAGAATGAAPVISSQGSDAAVGLTFNTKSTGVHTFQTNGTTRLLINSGGTVQLGYANATPCFTAIGVASQVNGFQVSGSVAGSAPSLSSTGTDADIDLTLTPKGAGRVNITTSIKPKVNSAASVTSPLAWNSTSYDEYALTALANALTINADANTAPADGQRMMFRFKDNGTARALTWTTGATNAFRVVGVTLPTTTVASKLLYVGCIYNAADSRWDAIAVGQEA